MSKSFEIIGLRPRFAKALGLFFSALRTSGDGSFFHPHPLDAVTAGRLARYRGKDLYYVCMDTEKERVFGYGMLRGWDAGYEIPSLGMAVHPSARGCGIGTALLSFLHAAAAYNGASRIRLKVYLENKTALSLYRKFGYKFGTKENGQVVGLLSLGHNGGKAR